MAVFPSEFTKSFDVTCKCGQALKGEITVSNAKVTQEKLEEAVLDLSQASILVRWENNILCCPSCDMTLPLEWSEEISNEKTDMVDLLDAVL